MHSGCANLTKEKGDAVKHPRRRATLYYSIRGKNIQPMILEVAILDVKPSMVNEFETAFKTASTIIASMPGYISHELQRCLETTNRYILLVRWQTLEDHTIGFRQSPEYQQWRSLLHHFYDPFPTVEHYEVVAFR
jgi:heme-degrading monooxygenase HmoA